MKDKLKLKVYKCPICKRNFYIHCLAQDYGWSKNNKIYCSFSCLRKEEKREEQKNKKNVVIK